MKKSVVFGWIFVGWCAQMIDRGLTSRNVEDPWNEGNEILHEPDIDNWFHIDDEDGDLTVPELIIKYGYQVQSHTVTTEDGYILTMFRIIPRVRSEQKKLPILMVHGLLGSSADYVISGPNNSLAYYLSDRGYDVWLANVRGSRYSKEHKSLPVNSKEYWDFTWHEMGYYDLPAMIDYVLDQTGTSQLLYIGHSQGATAYFAMTSSRPEYNDKIALMTALAPAVVLNRVRSPILRVMLELADTIKNVLDSLHMYEFFPYNEHGHQLAEVFCPKEEPNNICSQLVAQVVGPHLEMYSQKLALAYMGHSPAGASTKQLMHYVQVVRSGLFQQYDYGKKGNLQTYSNWKPPVYNLSASVAPVQIYYALNDWMVHPRDAQQFAKMVPGMVASVPVADKRFNHLDFVIAKNARSEVYDKLIVQVDRYNDKNNSGN